MSDRMRGVLRMFLILLFLFGLGVILYPTLNGLAVDWQMHYNAQEFLSRVEVDPYVPPASGVIVLTPEEEPEPTLPEEYPELWQAMKAYNADLYASGQSGLTGKEAYETPSFSLKDHGIEDGIFAVLNIPALELEMPVFLGASKKNMAAGAAVMGQTSIPIGGTNSNAILAGHRGWNGAAYFLHIDRLKLGDEIILTNLWEELHYQVVDIQIIAPYEVEAIKIQPGRDLITLLTCHPPATGGRQRYLVIAERIT